MCTHARLDAGLLVCAEHELIPVQVFALPAPGIQLNDAPGLAGEVRIAREDPGAMLPGSNRSLVQPAPHRSVADARDDAAVLRLAQLKRDSGRPRVAGSSQASALICTTSSGGKDPGAARARALFKPLYSLMEEALAPQAHHVAAVGSAVP